MSRSTLIYGASIAVHVGLAVTVASIEYRERGEIIAIEMADAKAKEKPKDPPKKVEPARMTDDGGAKPKPKPAAPKAKVAPADAKPAAAPPPTTPQSPAAAALDALPDFGIHLTGGTGGTGFAVPQGNGQGPVAAAAAAQPKAQAPKALAPKPADECTEPPVKPKPKGVPSPAYTSAAREANVEGKVRVQVTVAPDGTVTGAQVLSGLGYGLDEAALAAARRATFEPGTRCGKPVTATFVIAMRFAL